MRIKIEKLFDEKDDSLRVIEELYIKLPKKLVEGLGWEDGDLVEFEILDTSFSTSAAISEFTLFILFPQ